MLLVKGTSKATVTAMRPDEILLVMVDPAKGTAQVEKALHAWASNGAAAAAGASPGSSAPAAPPGVSATAAPRSAPAEARGPASADPWAALRRSLVRGLLTEAAARRREIADATPTAGRVGAERLAAAEIEQAMETLVQGIGSVLAGDGLGGARTLEALAGDSQKNLSFRWLALWWSARAVLKSGNSAAARTHVKQALAFAKQLDREAVAVSQWVAAKVLMHDGEHGTALAYLEQARAAFQRLGDRWGVGQTWLAEARALLAQERDQEAVAAARQAWATDRGWEEPVVFLARRALLRGDLAEAEGLLRYVNGQSAERLRSLIEAIREQGVSQADAIEFLRESDAPPTVRSIRAMERLAQASPRFVQARDALA
jgi:tetratricopeptide (TPR) repeat protein